MVGWAFLTLVALIVLEVALILASSLVYSVFASSETSGVQATAYPAPMLSAPEEVPVPDPYLPDPNAVPTGAYSSTAAPYPTYVPPPGYTPEYTYPGYEPIYPGYQPTLADRVSGALVWASGFGGLVTGILAIVMLPRATSVSTRSRWLGIIIGSAVHLIVFGGLCVVFLRGFQ